MKGLRGLFRLGTLVLLALTLMVAMVLPASADDQVCSTSQMLDQVDIVSVMAKEAPAVWSAQDLVNFDHDGDIENGLLEIKFKDIATDFLFDGYIIEAVPGDDDPGDSEDFGVGNYKSDSLIARPAVVGSTVTKVLNLEPGTKYYVTVYAVNHNTVQISPDQRAQDSSSATTLLTAPFLGALEWGKVHDEGTTAGQLCAATDTTTSGCEAADPETWSAVLLEDEDFQGAHFAFHDAKDEADQHYFRWLNPGDYGPFDHLRDSDHVPAMGEGKQADMLSFDGVVEDHCVNADIDDGDCGHTHYQFRARDDNGNTVASELVETGGSFKATGKDYFQTVFTAEDGDLTLEVSLGRLVNGNYKAMSDTASVMFETPDDLRAFDQTYDEYDTVLDDITAGIDENEDAVNWLGKNSNGSGRSIWNPDEDEDFATSALTSKGLLIAYLNNQLK